MNLGAVVVTGASTGIGEAVALALDKLGITVFAGVRKPSDGEALQRKASSKLTPLILDVTDAQGIAGAAEHVAQAVGEAGLGGLVNNAGIAVAGPLECLPLDDLRRQLEVNVVGQIAVTQAFLPLLRKARGRIVNIGSMSGRVAGPFVGAYAASKFALEALTASLRMELKPWGIHVCLVGPGSIDTPIWSKSTAEADALVAKLPKEALDLYGSAIAQTRQYVSKIRGIPTSEVSTAVLHALTSPRPRTRYAVGKDARVAEIGRLLPDTLRESMILRRF